VIVCAALVAVETPASAATNPAPDAGVRAGATALEFGVSGTSKLSVDVGTGNALYADQLISLPGVTEDVPIMLSYNSSMFGTSTPSAVTGDTGSGWSITGFDNRLVQNSDNSVTFYGQSGLTGVFAANGTAYTAPTQFQADLVKTGTTGWTLTGHDTQTKLTFNASGRMTKIQDRNGNATTFNYSGGLPASIVASRGTTATATLTIATSGNRITSLTQTAGSLTRQVQLSYTSAGKLATITDTAGGQTSFFNPAGDDGKVVRITNPLSATTTLAYSGSKATSVEQSNAAGAGTSTTRFAYPSSTQTLVADALTNQSASVASVPHATYALTSAKLVSSATDPNGHTSSATYTSLGQIKTETPAAGGITTNTYGANGAESLTASVAPGGASDASSYGNAGSNSYLPSSSTDDASSTENYTYNSAGNQLTTAQGTSPQAKLTYNSDGTVATSASAGAPTGVQTAYTYDATTKNLTHMEPPSDSTLGNRDYEWDNFGRLTSTDDGRGEATRYVYDKLDNVTRVDYTDETTSDVAYTYDANGNVLTRTDGTGVTTYTYDDLGQILTKKNTAGGETMSYTYDKAGNIKTQADYHGTITYTYDDASQLKYMIYPQGGSTSQMSFAYDDSGRRTDTWLKSNSTNSTWSAHTKTTYDSSGRVTAVKSDRGPAGSPTAVVDLTYCFAAGTTPAGGCTTSTASDRANIQWIKNAVTGQATQFTYNADDRLTTSVVTGGSNPRTYSYTYDTAGNRLTSSVNGNNPSTQTLTYNAANQITTAGYGYDAAGSMTYKPGMGATFNTAGQMTSRTATSGPSSGQEDTTYSYAGTDQTELTRMSTPGDVTFDFAYGVPDENGNPVINELTRTENGTSVDAYVTHDNNGTPVMLQTSTGQSGMYVYDGMGNPVSLTTEGSATSYLYEFDPYGGATTTQNSGGTGYIQNPYTYGGGLQDKSTGLIKFGQRWYDPATGAWAQQDILNAPLDPANANRYAFANGNPVNFSDPSGLGVWKDIKKGAKKAKKAVTKVVKKVAKKITFKSIAFRAVPWGYLAKCAVAGSYNVYRGDFGNGNKYKVVGDFIAGCI
jgi:RHS repeat-associated protein